MKVWLLWDKGRSVMWTMTVVFILTFASSSVTLILAIRTMMRKSLYVTLTLKNAAYLYLSQRKSCLKLL